MGHPECISQCDRCRADCFHSAINLEVLFKDLREAQAEAAEAHSRAFRISLQIQKEIKRHRQNIDKLPNQA